MQPRLLIVIAGALLLLSIAESILAGPSSSNYKIDSYSFGAGGIASASSDTYNLTALAGEVGAASASSTNYSAEGGIVYTSESSIPPAPGLTNPGSTYNRLKLVINPGSNATDAAYIVAITDDNWATTKYVQSDYTVGSTFGSEDWLTYDEWGDTGGVYITGLSSDTSYSAKVKAKTGTYDESGWGPTATAATVDVSITFGVSSSTVTFDPLTPANTYTDATKSTIITTSTNAYNGYIVYGSETGALTFGSNTIPDYSGTNANPTAWSGTGFGYTTSDSSLTGGTTDRFTSGGAKYAGFTTASPGDPIADHIGPVVETPITNEEFTISYRVTANAGVPAGRYTTKLIYIVVPTY